MIIKAMTLSSKDMTIIFTIKVIYFICIYIYTLMYLFIDLPFYILWSESFESWTARWAWCTKMLADRKVRVSTPWLGALPDLSRRYAHDWIPTTWAWASHTLLLIGLPRQTPTHDIATSARSHSVVLCALSLGFVLDLHYSGTKVKDF